LTKFFFAESATRILLLVAAVFSVPAVGLAQAVAVDDLPDAPLATAQQSSPPPTPAQAPAAAPAQTQSPAQSDASSSAQPAQTTPETKEQKAERAKRELEAEEHQRMLGVVPLFNVQDNANAAPMTSKQKFQLFFKSSTDWYVFAITAIDGEISMLDDEYPTYGEGAEGFAKYWGAAYADTFDGNLWGNAILTSWWKEDPRYYRMGHGKFIKRAAYAAATTVWCKRDKGTWGPNYANVAGNFVGGAISNLYYPADQRGFGLTMGRGASVTYEGIVGGEIAEFWPDIAQHFMKKRQQKLDHQDTQPPAPPAPASTSPKPQ
jgi:hypothetical protein